MLQLSVGRLVVRPTVALGGKILLPGQVTNGELTAIGGYDPDALIYFAAVQAAGVTLTGPQKNAWNTFVVSAKSNSYWDDLLDIKPCLGATKATCSINAKNPALYLTSWTGDNGSTFTADGITGNASLQGETGVPADVNGANSLAFGFYSLTNEDSLGREYWANLVAEGTALGIFTNLGGTTYFDNNEASARITASNTGSAAMFVSSRTAANACAGYINGASVVSTTNAQGALTSDTFLLFNSTFQSTRTLALAFISKGLSAVKVAALYAATQAFQTALGRAVILALLFTGDSIPRGFGLATPATQCFPAQTLALDNRAEYRNSAVDATTIADAQAAIGTQVTPYIIPGWNNVGTPFIGTNSLFFGATGADAYAEYVTYCNSIRAAGVNRVIACNILDRTEVGTPVDFNAQRAVFNGLVAANWPTFADAFFDASAVLPDSTDLADFQAGGTHPNATGAGKLASVLQPIIASVS